MGSCELASITELELDLDQKDADFLEVTKKFLRNLRLVDNILPLPQWTCGETEEIIAVGSTCDGGILGFWCVNYLICQNMSTQEKTSRICCSRSKVSKRTILANEALVRILQLDLTESVARVISR